MASDKNTVEIAGNLVKDPFIKTTHSGTPICNFSIASNRYRKSGDGYEKETSFLDVQCWGNLALTVSESYQKGTPVEVKGRLKQERWTGGDGRNQSKIVIVAEIVVKQQRQERQTEPHNDWDHQDAGDRDDSIT